MLKALVCVLVLFFSRQCAYSQPKHYGFDLIIEMRDLKDIGQLYHIIDGQRNEIEETLGLYFISGQKTPVSGGVRGHIEITEEHTKDNFE